MSRMISELPEVNEPSYAAAKQGAQHLAERYLDSERQTDSEPDSFYLFEEELQYL